MIRAAVVIAALVAACVQPRTYSYQYKMKQTFETGEEPDPVTREASELLATAKTVAFFPPDYCLNVDGSRDGNSKTDRVLRANCGVLLSTLERAAERAGYQVFSWQNLRGGQRPIDFAREASVDVLFEINEFDLSLLDGSKTRRELAFFERTGSEPDRPLAVGTDLANRCRSYAASRDGTGKVALSGTIDIKTVAVADGRNRWRYRKTLSKSLAHEYPKVSFTAAPRPSKLGSALLTIGIVAATTSLALAITDATSNDDPTTTYNEDLSVPGSVHAALLLGAALGVGGGAAAIAFDTKLPTVDETLCVDGPAVAGDGKATTSVATDASSSTHTFDEQQASDANEVERKQVRDAMIADFVQVLMSARTDAAAVPAADPR